MASKAECTTGGGAVPLSAAMESLRASLRRSPPAVPLEPRPEVLRGDLPAELGHRAPTRVREAAVTVAIRESVDGALVLFTRRTDHLKDHAGQVSFPGGGVEAGDRGPVHTAFREAEEEVGLREQAAQVLGFLDLYLTITGYAVTPVVCNIHGDFEPVLDPHEVASVFEVPLEYLLDPANHEYVTRAIAGTEVGYWRIRWQEELIWGATAGMLRDLYERVRGGGPDGG